MLRQQSQPVSFPQSCVIMLHFLATSRTNLPQRNYIAKILACALNVCLHFSSLLRCVLQLPRSFDFGHFHFYFAGWRRKNCIFDDSHFGRRAQQGTNRKEEEWKLIFRSQVGCYAMPANRRKLMLLNRCDALCR